VQVAATQRLAAYAKAQRKGREEAAWQSWRGAPLSFFYYWALIEMKGGALWPGKPKKNKKWPGKPKKNKKPKKRRRQL
jgi:hypothetical protein